MARYSAAVYRRRRITVVAMLLVIVALIGAGVWALVAQPWNAAAAGGEQPTPPVAEETPKSADAEPTETPTPTPTPDAPEVPAGPVACEQRDVEVVAVSDKDTYAAGELPQLSISLTNKGDKDCTLDVGSATQIFTVTSGRDIWWSSTHCQSDAAPQMSTLAAGQTVSSSTPVQWDRTRSTPESCESTTRPIAPGGGASYHLSVVIGGFESKTTKQMIIY